MWGINGATSVVASVLAMVVSLNIGLRGTLLVGVAVYAVAWLLIVVIWRRDAQPQTGGSGA